MLHGKKILAISSESNHGSLDKTKAVLCYLKGTKTCYLVFNKSSFDTDWKNSKDDHSITGYYFQLLPVQ